MTSRPMVVVTGSSKGIGRAIAMQLAAAGYDLILHGRSKSSELLESVSMLESAGVTAETITGDFSDFGDDDFQRFVSDVIQLSGVRLVGWVNNAGVDVLTGTNRDLDFAAKLNLVLNVDVRSTLLLTRSIAQHWSAVGNTGGNGAMGAVVNIGWDQADTGLPGDSGQMFAASKGAIMAMTGSLAQTYAPRVRVNCVAPGWIKTEWGESADQQWDDLVRQQSCLNRWGNATDIASTVGFLLSPAAQFINGQVIRVNGGLRSCSDKLTDKLTAPK